MSIYNYHRNFDEPPEVNVAAHLDSPEEYVRRLNMVVEGTRDKDERIAKLQEQYPERFHTPDLLQMVRMMAADFLGEAQPHDAESPGQKSESTAACHLDGINQTNLEQASSQDTQSFKYDPAIPSSSKDFLNVPSSSKYPIEPTSSKQYSNSPNCSNEPTCSTSTPNFPSSNTPTCSTQSLNATKCSNTPEEPSPEDPEYDPYTPTFINYKDFKYTLPKPVIPIPKMTRLKFCIGASSDPKGYKKPTIEEPKRDWDLYDPKDDPGPYSKERQTNGPKLPPHDVVLSEDQWAAVRRARAVVHYARNEDSERARLMDTQIRRAMLNILAKSRYRRT